MSQSRSPTKMNGELAKTYDWMRSTLEDLASIPRLSDEDFAYTIFEVLDADARWTLSEVALDRLDDSISDVAKSEIRGIRSAFLDLVDSAHPAEGLPVAKVRQDDRWSELARTAERVLSEYFDDDTVS